ncbi:MAG: methionyl-tRNA formyltransferase [Candidatus Liptonbacteria bacterium]
MKYIFFGTPVFAARVLEGLCAAGISPLALICNPDRPMGRKKTITAPPAKQVAQKWDVMFLQPEKLEEAIDRIKGLQPEFFVVAAYGHILKKDVLDIPPLGTIGVHPSLLPELRGASPIQSAILRGDPETGISLYLLDEKMDHGPILAADKISVGENYYPELRDRLAELAGKMLIRILPLFKAGKITPKNQNHELATFTAKFSREDGFLDPVFLGAALRGESPDLVREINNKIHALATEPGTWTYARALAGLNSAPGTEVKILNSRIDGGKLILEKIQPAGKNPQNYRK